MSHDVEQERLALQRGPAVVGAALRELQSAQHRARDAGGRIVGVRELERVVAALRMANSLNAENRAALLNSVATDATLALLVRFITEAEQRSTEDAAARETTAVLRSVLATLFAARRAQDRRGSW
jgi:hypothetical protein